MSPDKKMGLCLKAGIPTTTKHDVDGLPIWRYYDDPVPVSSNHPIDESGYHHGDGQAMMLATYFQLHGFSLPQFDLWLGNLGACGAKAELLERRGAAIAAAIAKNKDGMLRHLEWIMRRRFEIEREDFLLPKARHNENLRSSQKRLRGSKMPKLDAWLDSQNLDLPCDDLWELLPSSDENEKLYRDGKKVVEVFAEIKRNGDSNTRDHSIGRDGFDGRVRSARKRR